MIEPVVSDGFLTGVRVVEIADEHGEYCGKLLAGLGADVIKVEPPAGEHTRWYGPFYRDVVHPDQSLYYWHYNFGKRGAVIDLDHVDGVKFFRDLVATADVVIDGRPRGFLDDRGIGYESLREDHADLVFVRITPFGDNGPWAAYHGSDLVHLALGGVSMNCGYDPDLLGNYDTPPIAPQMWQAYQITGEIAAIGILAALNHQLASGIGQYLAVNVHEATSMNTETDLPDWIYLRRQHLRQTCRHSMSTATSPALSMTKDGRWLLPYRTYLSGFLDPSAGTYELLRRYGMDDGRPSETAIADHEGDAARERLGHLIDELIGQCLYEADLWREAQALGLAWAPVRRPEENLADAHWHMRETFFDVPHPELKRSFAYVGAKWFAPEVPWRKGPRAPLLDEHTDQIAGEVRAELAAKIDPQCPTRRGRVPDRKRRPSPTPSSGVHALAGVRVIDLSWLLASGGAGRFFSALGAEVIRVEHDSRLDGMRVSGITAPIGGRTERDAATGPLAEDPNPGTNRGGAFNEINPGKRSLGLNLKHPRGKELLQALIKDADIVIEGFSPGTMERMGFGYEKLRSVNPDIIYVQQSGMGQFGSYGAFRSYGPTAQAVSGISDMSGLPEPYPPAGIGYSYLDWFGAYNMAVAMMAALYRRRATGKGCHIDASQAETGIYLTGAAVLDYSANNRRWQRYGNRSPYKPAAPSGNYLTLGTDRWIAISCFTEGQWESLCAILAIDKLASDPRFDSLAHRLIHQDELDEAVAEATRTRDGYELMDALQRHGVASGVCQEAQDRYELDPQLHHLGWLVEVDQTEIGRWPIKEIPIHFEQTPSYIGGTVNRGAPNYGEDNIYVLSEILHLDEAQIRDLYDDGVVSASP
jgi:crotonobetainyl-CoA:carnitine CoA-transferase CaiB-like acyl-CoA transferase